MKPLLFVLLAASLVANVALVVLSRHPTAPDSATAALTPAVGSTSSSATAAGQNPPTAGTNRSGGPTAVSAVVPPAWHGTTTDEDLHHLVAGLRAAGYPASLIRAVINQLLNERFAARSPNAGQPFWKRSAPTPETLAAQTALGNERRALFDSLLGPDARPSALLDADTRERRYGPLGDDKIDAIAKIERDYQEISAETWAKRKGNFVTSTDAMIQGEQLMQKEKLADLAGVLTPEELSQYEMRNSPAAQKLSNNLRNVDVTEAEYAQLYAAQKSFDAANPLRASMDGSAYLQRQLAQMSLNEQVKAVLGDTRFYTYLEGSDGMYAMTARALNKYPTVTPATTYQVYQLQVELQGQIAQNPLNKSGASEEQAAAMRNLVETYNTKLEALVGPAVAEAYRNQGMGQLFKSFRGPTRTVVPVTK